MSALDYTAEAEDNREECIDALTRYRPQVKRKNNCFLTKSRFNIDRILGDNDLVFSTTLDTTATSNVSNDLPSIPAKGASAPHRYDISDGDDVVVSIDDVDSPCVLTGQEHELQGAGMSLNDDRCYDGGDALVGSTSETNRSLAGKKSVLVKTLKKGKYLKLKDKYRRRRRRRKRKKN